MSAATLPPAIVRPREWEKTLKLKCSFCGGKQCRRCSKRTALNKIDSPIHGLHADWVTTSILGTMRPSSKLIREFNIFGQFHRHNIVAIFNLTMPGEHPYCGDGILSSGFPYDPEEFMAEKINFYNFGWEDMTVPTCSYMMNIVKVMASELKHGNKIAVHCHAGYGRTGLAIACSLMFMHKIDAKKAIEIVRKQRPGSIQTVKQVLFVSKFQIFLNIDKAIFAIPSIHNRFTIAEHVKAQNNQVVEYSERQFRNLPMVVDRLCNQIECDSKLDPEGTVLDFICHVPLDQRNTLSQDKVQVNHLASILGGKLSPNLLKSKSSVSLSELHQAKLQINCGNWDEIFHKCNKETKSISSALLLDWLEHLRLPLLDTQFVAAFLGGGTKDSVAEVSGSKWDELNRHSMTVIDTLRRLSKCVLQLSHTGLADAVYARAIVAILQLDSTKNTLIPKYVTFMKLLGTEWNAPTSRLKINREKIEQICCLSAGSSTQLKLPKLTVQ